MKEGDPYRGRMSLRARVAPLGPAALALTGVLDRSYVTRPAEWQYTSALGVIFAIFGGIAVWYLFQIWLARRAARKAENR